MLQHSYSIAGMKLSSLKGADRGVASVLRQFFHDAGMSIRLAILEMECHWDGDGKADIETKPLIIKTDDYSRINRQKRSTFDILAHLLQVISGDSEPIDAFGLAHEEITQ